jgi:tetraacyldisaccharide 4'-kinase
MPLATPGFWYGQGPGALPARLLRPIGELHHRIVQQRLRGGAPASSVPVICIGNATVGGVGKTPVVRRLGEVLRERGHRVHILTRGYGGSLKGPVRVLESHAAAEVGDEPKMLARDLPVWIAKDRGEGAETAADAGAEVILMDDGLQNPSVTKRLSILVVDEERWFGNGLVFPAGPLREHPEAALSRSAAVISVLPGGQDLSGRTRAFAGDKPLFAARFVLDMAGLPEGPFAVFCGIGQPERFRRSLENAGATIAFFEAFADHHALSAGELASLRERAARAGARLVTTEKDFARLPEADRAGITPVRGQMHIEQEDRLVRLLEEVL